MLEDEGDLERYCSAGKGNNEQRTIRDHHPLQLTHSKVELARSWMSDVEVDVREQEVKDRNQLNEQTK